MRTRIRESLIDNLLYNERRRRLYKTFEFSDIYTSNSTKKKLGSLRAEDVDIIMKNSQNKLIRLSECIFDNADIEGDFSFELVDRKNLDTKVKVRYIMLKLNSAIRNVPFLQDDRYIDSFFFNKYKPISISFQQQRFSFSLEDSSNLEIVLKELSNMEHPNLKMSFIFDFYKK